MSHSPQPPQRAAARLASAFAVPLTQVLPQTPRHRAVSLALLLTLALLLAFIVMVMMSATDASSGVLSVSVLDASQSLTLRA